MRSLLSVPLVGMAFVSPLAASAQQTAPTTPPAQNSPIAPRKPSKVASEGQYTDREKQKHNWQINGAHTLIWDNRPYIPVGGRFIPKSLSQSDEPSWQNDQAAIANLKAHGLQDILIAPSRSFGDIDPKALQRLIDHLEANGFRYGLAFGAGIQKRISGYVVKPTVYRLDARPSPVSDPLLTGEWITANSDHGMVFFYDGGNESTIFKAFKINIADGIATIPIETPANVTHPFVLLVPHKTLPDSEKGTLPDLWSEFDRYRDRCLHVASQIKWGQGLRFFLDPLTSHLGISGEAQFLVPDSLSFRLEWESFLARKYTSTETVRAKWGLLPRFNSFAELARLVPLWAYGRGCPSFYDPDNTPDKQLVRLQEGNQSAGNSTWWNDFQAFRESRITYYMNSMADVLKRQVADVPVVYTWTPNGSFFTNYQEQGGFDGLAIATHLNEPSRLSRITGPAYSQAEQALRTTWFITSELMEPEPLLAPTRPAGPTLVRTTDATLQGAQTTAAPPLTKPTFTRDLDDIRRIGSKGLFVNLPTSAPTTNAATAPDILAWQADYATTLRADTALASLRPQVLFYPQLSAFPYNFSGPIQTGYVPGASNIFWLPGAYYGEAIDYWPFCWGYNIRRDFDDSQSTVMMTFDEPQKAHFAVLNPTKVRAFTPDGRPVPVKVVNKTQVEILLNKTPTIIQFDSDISPIPEEAAIWASLQLSTLHDIAKLQKIFGVESSTLAMDQAKDYIVKKNFSQAYGYARSELDKLLVEAAPYIWLEGEHDRLLESKVPLFNELAGHPQASSGVYLRLATPNRPNPQYGYKARYEFNVNKDGLYQIWLAGSLPGPNTSPIKWNIDNTGDRDMAEPNAHGTPYLNDYFGWMVLGSLKLTKGTHKLTIEVTDPAPASHEYSFAIDALMITDRPFVPNGIVKPLPVDDFVIRDMNKRKKGDPNDLRSNP